MILRVNSDPLRSFTSGKRVKNRPYFSMPILKRYLPVEHFYHHSLLVSAIRMLCGDEITDHDIDIAEAMLVTYTHLLASLFNETECTYTTHALTHLPPTSKGSWTMGSSFYICL